MNHFKAIAAMSENRVIGREMKRETLRELIIRPYRLIYEIDDRNCAINVRVLWHGARKEPELR